MARRGDIASAPTLMLHKATVARDSVSRSARDLSSDVSPRAARRIQFVSMIMAIGGLAVMVGDRAGRDRLSEFLNAPEAVSDAIAIGTSLVVFALARWSRLRLSTLVGIALSYEVVASAAISVDQFWELWAGMTPTSEQIDATGLGWVAVWIVVFAVVVPVRPSKALVASIASAATVPIVVGLSIFAGRTPSVPAGAFVAAFVMPYLISAFTAYVAAQIIYRLGRQVREAQALGSYQLERCLGRGGMGEVWLARHHMLARPAAIKLIRLDVLAADGDINASLARFEREAAVTASLESPHTVQLFDFGSTEDGTLYYAMEHLKGIDLFTLVRRFGPVPQERAVFILRQVCDSLAEAHGRGLIHRDIKPSNIFVGRYGGKQDFAKVLDFGLVKQQARADEVSASLTQAGTIVGTPAFMAPEAALTEDVDALVDIYALGCVAFWLVVGGMVFEERSPMAMLLAHINRPPPSVLERAPGPISPELAQLIEACLAKQPEDRPRGAEALARALEAIDLPHEWTEVRAKHWWDEADQTLLSADTEPEAVE